MELADTLSPACRGSSVLSDVNAYVDVWSSNRTENYAKTFSQQLLNLGAKVSKTFNKTVTHLVFKDGSQGVWDKAVKSGVKLVSVLWVEKCREAAAHVDESIYPAINTNNGLFQLTKKKRRCMQPKDFVEKTPENDRRLARRFDKMYKELDGQKASVDIPILSFEEDGTLLFSPKAVVADRCNAMEKRINEMKNKRENLSPTASQRSETMFDFSSLKPSLGNSPSVMTDSPYEHCTNNLDTSYDDIGSLDKGKQVPATSRSKKIHVVEDTEDAFTLNAIHFTPEKAKEVITSLEAAKKRNSSSRIKNKGWKSLNKLKTTDRTNDCLSDVLSESHTGETPDLDHSSLTNTVIAKAALDVRDTPSSIQSKRRTLRNRMQTTDSTTDNDSGSDALSEPTTAKGGTSDLDYTSMANRLIAICKEKEQSKKKCSPRLKSELSSKGVLKEPEKLHLSSCSTEDTFSNFEDFFTSDLKRNPCKMSKYSFSLQPRRSPSPPPFTSNNTSNKADYCKRRRSVDAHQQDATTAKRRTIHAVTHSISTPNESLAALQEAHVFPTVSEENDLSSRSCEMSNRMKSPVGSRSKKSSKTYLQKTEINLSGNDKLQITPDAACTNGFEPSLCLTNGLKKVVSPATCKKTQDEPGDKESLSLTNGTVLNPEKQMKSFHPSAESKTFASDARDGLSEMFNEQRNKCTEESKKIEKSRKITRSLVMTSMGTENQNAVIQVVKKFGGFVFSDCVCETTTHVIAGSPRRTLNIILGIARGCWIISYDWVLWSLERGHWIPEEPYELSDYFPGAPICRLQRHLSAGEYQLDLLSAVPALFISPSSQPPCHTLCEVVQLCGGKVCKTLRQAKICIGSFAGKKPTDMQSISEKWLLDSVTQHKLHPLEDYLLEQ
ncbi:microcephalin [Mixophyes fleayi]|uniref:microcephalin n=1 Tax=Mixophyes fleayi TaxID=3061075 RepID=UPI003F4DE93D